MAFDFPADCDTPRRRVEYCYRALELLRRIHNFMGRWYREGVTKAEWDQLPARVRTRYPYSPMLTDAQWKDFQELYLRLEKAIWDKMHPHRESLRGSSRWSVDPTDFDPSA